MNDLQPAATHFVEARRAARGFADYPGPLPEDLDAAYGVQAAAIADWGDQIAGWKVGRIQPHLTEQLRAERFIGPIFAQSVARACAENEFPAFSGGLAMFEAELLICVAEDAPADKLDWTTDETLSLVGAMHVGIEVAGSPLASINDLGSLATIAGFGNNNGLIIGSEISDWRERHWEEIMCAVSIDGEVVREASAAAVPGGPLEVLAFALGEAARRGYPIRRGEIISTGAITGMHPVTVGQRCIATFAGIDTLDCRVVTARMGG